MEMPMHYGYRPPALPLVAPVPAPVPGGAPWLINECRIEGERCFVMAYQLVGLAQAMVPAYQAHVNLAAEEARVTGNHLRTLADATYTHFQRVDLVLSYLALVLPSIKRTLSDITKYYEDRTKTREMRWRVMYHQMTAEAGNVPLHERFSLYSAFLNGLYKLLVRDIHFDDNRFQSTRDHILTLRGQQKLAAPVALPPPNQPAQLQLSGPGDEDIHWAQDIFSRPLPSRTLLKNVQLCELMGPFSAASVPPNSKIFFEREFDKGAVSVTVYDDRIKKCPLVLLTKRHMGGVYCCQMGAHELGITRNHSSLELKRWSKTQSRPILWAVLYFITWEEQVLFYCAFISLKTNSPLTRRHNPSEFSMAGEKRLFQAKIIDDDYNHSLIVYKDRYTKGWRLHAAVWDGELRQAPMWTAFISDICKEARFIKKRSKRRVWLHDIDIYTFNSDYHPEHQRHNRGSAFEIKFDSEPGARHFLELFQPSSTEPSEATASTADSDEDAADDDDHNVRAQVKTISASTSTSTSNVTSATTSEDGGSNLGYSRDHSDEDEDDDDEDDEDDDDDIMIASEETSESGAADSDIHEIHNESQHGDWVGSDGNRSEAVYSDAPPRQHRPTRISDYDYIAAGEISVEEINDDDSDSGSLGGLSDGATLKMERRESLLEAPEELNRLEGPDELSRLEAPKEPAKITDGRPPKPSVEDCSDDDGY